MQGGENDKMTLLVKFGWTGWIFPYLPYLVGGGSNHYKKQSDGWLPVCVYVYAELLAPARVALVCVTNALAATYSFLSPEAAVTFTRDGTTADL